MRFVPRLRLAEWLVLAWVGFIAAVHTLAHGWQRVRALDPSAVYVPMFLLLLLILCQSLLQVLLAAVRNIAVAVGALQAGPGVAVPPSFTVDWREEMAIVRSLGGFLRDCAPLFLVVLFYPSTDFLNETLQGGFLADPWLARIDLLVFRSHWSVWMERFASPGLTDWLSLCYFLHLVIPTVILIYLRLRAPRRLFVEAVQGFVLILLVGFALYLAVPAIGPKYELAPLYARDLAGGWMGTFNRVVIDMTRVPRDAFPSLHVGLSALLLVYAWRGSRWFAALVSPFIVGNWVATIYLRYHYTIDVVAGFLLVPAVLYTVSWWERRFAEAAPGG